jgi:hypothetical protein
MSAAFAATVGEFLGADAVADTVGESILKELQHSSASANFIDRIKIDRPSKTFDEAIARRQEAEEDVPQFTPRLSAIFDALDFNVARTAMTLGGHNARFAIQKAAHLRLGSVAANLAQQHFYWRVAASPAVRQVCEVGFNAGHSTALWLTANPTAHVATFDIFNNATTAFMVQNLMMLKRLFPGRVHAYAGDSRKTAPAAAIDSPCDLVHIDGRHSYENTVMDAYNLMSKAHPRAVFLFDDQCDVDDCRGINAMVASRPTLATCDMVLAGWLDPLVRPFGRRPFALFRLGPRSQQQQVSRTRDDRGRVLPCARCSINLTEPGNPLGERKGVVLWLKLAQDTMRNEHQCGKRCHEERRGGVTRAVCNRTMHRTMHRTEHTTVETRVEYRHDS